MTTVLGTFAASALLAVAVPTSAHAAEGVLIINGSTHENPSGCFPVDSFPSSVTNHTDALAEIHTGPGCGGPVEWLVYPGETYYSETAQSVFIL